MQQALMKGVQAMKNSMLVIGLAFLMAITCGCGPTDQTSSEEIRPSEQVEEQEHNALQEDLQTRGIHR